MEPDILKLKHEENSNPDKYFWNEVTIGEFGCCL